jgi:hypothetical protein
MNNRAQKSQALMKSPQTCGSFLEAQPMGAQLISTCTWLNFLDKGTAYQGNVGDQLYSCCLLPTHLTFFSLQTGRTLHSLL